MKRKFGMIALLGILLLGGCLESLPGLNPASPKLAGIFEGGKLYKAGTFNILDLHGSYRQMGRQYGRLLRSDLNAIYDEAINDLAITEFGNTFDDLLADFQPIFDAYPIRFKEIIRGMAETSGLSEAQLIVLNCLEMVSPAEWGDSPDHCSGIAVWGDYTGGGPLVFGRNYDFPELFKRFTKYFTVAIYNPTDSSVPTATMTYAGVIYLTSGMNCEGLFVELNNGSLSGGDTTYENRTMLPVSLLAAMFDSSSLDELDVAFNSTQTDLAYIVNVTDGETAYSYEWLTDELKRRAPNQDGVLVATNHFVDPSWNLPAISDEIESAYKTKLRRENLLALAEKYKGTIDTETMRTILDTTIEKGGATHPESTIYQIIAVPAELTLWIQAPGTQEWTAIDLARFFD